jgi:hypothetical protein
MKLKQIFVFLILSSLFGATAQAAEKSEPVRVLINSGNAPGAK